MLSSSFAWPSESAFLLPCRTASIQSKNRMKSLQTFGCLLYCEQPFFPKCKLEGFAPLLAYSFFKSIKPCTQVARLSGYFFRVGLGGPKLARGGRSLICGTICTFRGGKRRRKKIQRERHLSVKNMPSLVSRRHTTREQA